jgi:hypothetical protein
MWKTLMAVIVGALTWMVVATVINWLFRAGIPGYAEVERSMDFTLAMKIARLLLGAGASVAAGLAMGWIVRGKYIAPLVLGVILLAIFVPGHMMIWDKFPVWYHLTFLVLLLPMTLLGAWLAPRLRKPANAAPA